MHVYPNNENIYWIAMETDDTVEWYNNFYMRWIKYILLMTWPKNIIDMQYHIFKENGNNVKKVLLWIKVNINEIF